MSKACSFCNLAYGLWAPRVNQIGPSGERPYFGIRRATSSLEVCFVVAERGKIGLFGYEVHEGHLSSLAGPGGARSLSLGSVFVGRVRSVYSLTSERHRHLQTGRST